MHLRVIDSPYGFLDFLLLLLLNELGKLIPAPVKLLLDSFFRLFLRWRFQGASFLLLLNLALFFNDLGVS